MSGLQKTFELCGRAYCGSGGTMTSNDHGLAVIHSAID